jgi:hypothetical protein
MYLTFLLTPLKLAYPVSKSAFPEVVGWTLICCWYFWIAYAFQFDKDLPHNVSFAYKNGENQIARTMIVAVMLCLLCFAIGMDFRKQFI